MENSNIYQKLVRARKYVLENIGKKSGKNAFQKFAYFELADIVPAVQAAEDICGLVSVVSLSEAEAKITLINCEAPAETLELSLPLARLREAEALSPGQREQFVGSLSTYSRRYLLMQLYQIVEIDQIDAADNGRPQAKPARAATPQPTNYSVAPKTGKPWETMETGELDAWVRRMSECPEAVELAPWIEAAKKEQNFRTL